ncbi:DNAJ heat shock N-terminal domain-containing protein [Raphanus sativus]|nr:DNAJ heat shock N-terminal domain-containing protein [Raphanus sativus]
MGKHRKRDTDSDDETASSSSCSSYTSDDSDSSSRKRRRKQRKERRRGNEGIVKEMLIEFPNVGNDLKQLLKMIDDGQAVDIKGISEIALKKRLKKLFLSLKLKERGIESFCCHQASRKKLRKTLDDSAPLKKSEAATTVADENTRGADDIAGPKKRVIGPAMPSAELLAAAAKLTEAQAELREAELEEDSAYFIGPAPPAVVQKLHRQTRQSDLKR